MDELSLSLYDYELPEDLIAQQPAPERDRSRLLVLHRGNGAVEHRTFPDIAGYLAPGDCLVVNRSRVLPARLFGRKETGGRAEALFLKTEPDGGLYPALVRPALRPGQRLLFPGGMEAVVEGRGTDGEALLRLSGAGLDDVLAGFGRMPLPPYIKRPKDAAETAPADRERYQTVYAREQGSVAAPTAGLHFTERVLERIRERGVTVAEVVLHVGWGTFRPVTAEHVPEHRMLPEAYRIPAETVRLMRAAKTAGKRIVSVGTTTTRALESAFPRGIGEPETVPDEGLRGETSIFIYPGRRFAAIDALATNFHLPKSTPLLMVSALAGRERVLAAYREAVRERYRFFSYGDAMLVL